MIYYTHRLYIFPRVIPLHIFCLVSLCHVSVPPYPNHKNHDQRLNPSSALPPKLQTKTQISLAFCYFLLISWADKYAGPPQKN